MSLRDIPSVDHLLNHPQSAALISTFGRTLSVQAFREQLSLTRQAILEGDPPADEQTIINQAGAMLSSWLKPTLQPVINATGVIIHTNLGRSPLSRSAREAMLSISQGYSTLEFDLQRGKRGKRDMHTEALITRLTGAEAALVVNNNAAAILLALTSLARRKQVLIARSQLIEIGGGFRIPDVLKQSGAKLVEVGTTNRTHLHDFESAIQDRTALIMRAHHSNFKIVGFTTEPSLAELVELGRRRSVPILDDIGSGALLDTAQFGLGHEPTVQESLQTGASLIAFSGDKLLGGPQAGILVGEKVFIDKLRRQPLARAVRADKLCLAALSATLVHYMKGDATTEVPVWQMISATEDAIEARAQVWRKRLGQGEIISGRSTVGGGSLPEETLPTMLLALEVRHPNAFAGRLRREEPAIIARVDNDRIVLDPRTVLIDQETDLLSGIERVLKR